MIGEHVFSRDPGSSCVPECAQRATAPSLFPTTRPGEIQLVHLPSRRVEGGHGEATQTQAAESRYRGVGATPDGSPIRRGGAGSGVREPGLLGARRGGPRRRRRGRGRSTRASPSRKARSAPRAPRPGRFTRPGGGFGGSEAPIRRAIRIAQRNGLVVTSLKRNSGSTGSDHHVGQIEIIRRGPVERLKPDPADEQDLPRRSPVRSDTRSSAPGS